MSLLSDPIMIDSIDMFELLDTLQKMLRNVFPDIEVILKKHPNKLPWVVTLLANGIPFMRFEFTDGFQHYGSSSIVKMISEGNSLSTIIEYPKWNLQFQKEFILDTICYVRDFKAECARKGTLGVKSMNGWILEFEENDLRNFYCS